MSNGSSSREKATQRIDEVEELLRAAQDDMLLKLSLNSHTARSSPFSEASSTIDPDLDRRFQALKSKPKLSTSRIESHRKNPEKVVDNIGESDDLFARFTALKNSLPSFSSSSVSAGVDPQIKGGEENQSVDEEDEVEKVINWAIDTARLDPSPPSDADADADDDGNDDDEDDSDSEKGSDDEDNHKVNTRKKSKRK